MFAPITKTDRSGASGRRLVSMAHGILPVVSAALITSMPYFAPPAFAQSDSVGELLVGQAAFGDWRADAPLVLREITELPPPYATRSASNPPRVIAKPASAVPRVPPGFQVELFATDLRDPRVLRSEERRVGRECGSGWSWVGE